MPAGLISLTPQGLHHGPPEKARERARRKFDDYDKVEWSSSQSTRVVDSSRQTRCSPTIWDNIDERLREETRTLMSTCAKKREIEK